MRITVTRTGGFAGLTREATLDTAGRADAAGLEALAGRAVAEGSAAPPAGVPDGFAYRLTAGGRTVHFADPKLTDAQRALVRTVLKEGA
ncbi:metalloprotease [Streptomyces sp. CNQ-509]|uniref:protealysin inhibitor emfourin n=1 Tax=unclassified Streptomyces TaxID=2593676 RepID=UPI00062DE738|nr:protealysin inhibitor emfourin [Streptomyces sp. CNQ-509]AKH82382.1 metalloprotease [Streptomyces sp. CNQ-509]